MNDSILTQLKVVVERAVRPVRASLRYKQRTREELLAHVTAVFDEELATSANERLALERAEQRFGNPAELTAQLQQSIPRTDRWFRLGELVFLGSGVATWRLALHYALLTLCLPGVFLLIAYSFQGRLAEWPTVPAWMAIAFIAVVLLKGMRDALLGPGGRSWSRAGLVAVASWFVIPAVTFTLCLTFSGDWRSSLTNVLPLLPVALLTPAALVISVYLIAMTTRVQKEWTSLLID